MLDCRVHQNLEGFLYVVSERTENISSGDHVVDSRGEPFILVDGEFVPVYPEAGHTVGEIYRLEGCDDEKINTHRIPKRLRDAFEDGRKEEFAKRKEGVFVPGFKLKMRNTSRYPAYSNIDEIILKY